MATRSLHSSLVGIFGLFCIAIVACAKETVADSNSDLTQADAASTSDDAASSSDAAASMFDFDVQRRCTITAYESAVEPTKFAVGDYLVNSASSTTPGTIALSKIARRDEAGHVTEARFALNMRRDATHPTHMLTPYSPLHLTAEDARTLSFHSPIEFPDDTSTLKLSIPEDHPESVIFEFYETVHGNFGRSLTMDCVESR
jgi:hypothetical protein